MGIEVNKLLKTQDEIIKIVRDGQFLGKSFVVTNGCFDILHVGHVRYLKKTKEYADNLIVMLNSDISVKSIKGDSRPINCEADRAEILSSLSCVDYVVLFDEKSPAKLLESIKPDVYTKKEVDEKLKDINVGGGGGSAPVKGVDYWTPEDIAEIKSYVDDAILGGEW